MNVRRVNAGDQSGTRLRESDDADSLESEKQQLKNQIKELQALIFRAEASLDITKFGDVEKKPETFLQLTLNDRVSNKLVDTNVLFRNEIHRYIGFYCAKVDKTEYVFNYKPYNQIGASETFSVQIYNKDGKGTLGKWVMPMFVDINKILSETPIDDLSTIIPFLKNWKLYLDCTAERKRQLYNLKDCISDSRNCTVNADLGFTWITLQLFGVYDKPNDRYIDLTIYLSYKPNETRPCKIQTEWSLKKCSPKEVDELNGYTKFLKNHSILEGFRLMTEATHPVFLWTTKEDDSPLELSNTSDSDEESFLERIKLDRKKSVKKRRTRRESIKRSKRMKVKKKAEISQQGVNTDEEYARPSYETRLSSQKIGNTSKLRLQLRETNRSQSESENAVDELAKEPRRRLRQTTISFPSNKTGQVQHKIRNINSKKYSKVDDPKPADKIEKKSAPAMKREPLVGILSAKKKDAKKINQLTTSTPLCKKVVNRVKFVPMRHVEISPIVSADEKTGK